MERQRKKAFTLVELVVAMATASILMLLLGVLLLGTQNAYRQIYTSVHAPIQQDSLVISAAFGAFGRKANRNNYTLYQVTDSDIFIEAIPDIDEFVASGQAVEFRYWKQSFQEFADEEKGMDVDDTGTHYVLFYLVNDQLQADYGNVVDGIGAIQNGTRRRGDDVETRILVQDIDLSKDRDIFSHKIVGGNGSGCVNLHMTLKNDAGDTVGIETATLLRVSWPK